MSTAAREFYLARLTEHGLSPSAGMFLDSSPMNHEDGRASYFNGDRGIPIHGSGDPVGEVVNYLHHSLMAIRNDSLALTNAVTGMSSRDEDLHFHPYRRIRGAMTPKLIKAGVFKNIAVELLTAEEMEGLQPHSTHELLRLPAAGEVIEGTPTFFTMTAELRLSMGKWLGAVGAAGATYGMREADGSQPARFMNVVGLTKSANEEIIAFSAARVGVHRRQAERMMHPLPGGLAHPK